MGSSTLNRMGRALLAVGALLAVLIAGLAVVAWLGRPAEKLAVDTPLSESLTRAVATAPPGSNLRLRDLTDFSWDRLVLVAPRTPPEAITRRLGTEWKGDLGYDAGDLFIFLRDGDVVHFANYRGRGRFAGVSGPFAEFTPQTAVFTVDGDLNVTPRDHPHAGGGH
jgi:hypothetical protein